MTHQTPRHRLQRPSYSNMGSGEKPYLSASTTINRKASLQALTGQQDPRTPAPVGDDYLEVGDVVNVPGEMFGIVRFLGTVRGKSGKFVGVELDPEFAARGKNSGDVDGVNYFTTNIAGSGIFLPTHRAERRTSPTFSSDGYPHTPQTPSQSTINGQRAKATPTTPGLNSKYSQSVGPGAVRPSSPQFKPKRPSLPRPESPIRKPPTLQPTPARPGFSQSVRGARPPVTNTPSRNNLRASANARGNAQTPARPGSRNTSSRLGNRTEAAAEEERPRTAGRRPSNGIVPAYAQPSRSPSRLGSAGSNDSAQEVQRLKAQLAERDKRLDEQAASLAEMEASVKELSAIMPMDGMPPESSPSQYDDATVSQLRQMLREKNDRIGALTAEFDTHRADFRSTLDSLEMASAETERVYEEQKCDLLQQIAELQELNQQSQDFEAVASQLRQLEELVAELEEGLEESRRGEAEARGEVEFLRGEVERGRSELKREREKAAAVLKYTESGRSSINPKEMEEKDDEIKNLKAMINRISADTNSSGAIGFTRADPEELKKLQTALEESKNEKERLEKELEQLRRDAAAPTQNNGFTHTRQESEVTTLGVPTRGDGTKATFAEHARRSGMDDAIADNNGTSSTYCEMCGSGNHDTLDCTDLQPPALSTSRKPSTNGAAPVYSPGKENEHNSRNGSREKNTGAGDEEKWCALCEKDGHLAYDCPEEQF
ncbi:dynactin subunit 1 [Acrodontium crateriforme]|uniref:Dynactin subunit 1 n=1 Tax=Acrodontium crateriforme TaxID=150365 RepID=A0AAQ3M842_9PEZI|nr:dynactin subunit 1 [Acrodontium crateriforme]